MTYFDFPNIDPVALSLGPIEVRWYGISYVAGILLGWLYSRYLVSRYADKITRDDIDDFIVWATAGIILGGRLGWVLFYAPDGYFANIWEIAYLWKPGMSFHGGLVGVVLATAVFSYRRAIPYRGLGDILASAAPIGLLFGRIANFINGELYGRVTDSPWGMVFPYGGPLPRYPSQLFEAALEGLALFVIIAAIEHLTDWRKKYPGLIFGLFLSGYAMARSFVELYREPDSHIGFVLFGTTMGQLLSLPLLLAGLYFIWSSRR